MERPVEADDEGGAVEHDSWVIAVLVGEFHMAPDEIEKLTAQDAIDLVHKHWSRERLSTSIRSRRFVTYDERQAAAARLAGLRTMAPGT